VIRNSLDRHVTARPASSDRDTGGGYMDHPDSIRVFGSLMGLLMTLAVSGKSKSRWAVTALGATMVLGLAFRSRRRPVLRTMRQRNALYKKGLPPLLDSGWTVPIVPAARRRAAVGANVSEPFSVWPAAKTAWPSVNVYHAQGPALGVLLGAGWPATTRDVMMLSRSPRRQSLTEIRP
jgi:hypothetical protein